MAIDTDKLLSEIRALPKEDRIRLLDTLLTDLEIPDASIDAVWVGEARKRWEAYKEGKIETVAYEDLVKKYRS